MSKQVHEEYWTRIQAANSGDISRVVAQLQLCVTQNSVGILTEEELQSMRDCLAARPFE